MSLRLAGVGAAYRRRTVFENINLIVSSGEVLGLIGPNGAGKTTLLRIAAGLVRPACGRIVTTGVVMYFGGESTMPGRCGGEKWARLFGATGGTKRQIAKLSRGTRQLLGLGACLTRDDWAIGLLDEPWEGLDPAGSRWLTGALRGHAARGAAIVISSHRLHDAAEVCSSYAFLAHARLRLVEPSALTGADAPVRAADLARAFDEFTGL